ncbi:MAG: zinc-dependent metalloprotease [Dyadobacter sp.]|uniref:zinc-dependent metalloprotease n=1 Tax=Dyadobacter sp. TaxID=1914288 RepID=UPI0032653392
MKKYTAFKLLIALFLPLLLAPVFGQKTPPGCGTNDSLAAEYLAKYSKIKDLTKARLGAEEKLEYRLALDVNYKTYLLYNGDKDRITKEAYRFIQEASAVFERDVNIKLSVSFIYIWDKPEPYALEQDGDYYSNVLNYWEANRHEERDAVVSLSCRDGWFYGGYRMCSSNFPRPDNYAVSVDLLCHELGHTLGSPHTHSCFWPGGPIDRCTNLESTNSECEDGYPEFVNGSIMSYCRSVLSFHPLCQNLMRDYAEGKLQPSFKLNAFNEKPTRSGLLTLRNPDPGAATNTPSFEWYASLRVENYRFQIAKDEAFTQIVEDTLIKQSHFQSFGQSEGRYFARYRTENEFSAEGWSPLVAFTISPFSDHSEPPLLLNIAVDSYGKINGSFHKYADISAYEVEVTDFYENKIYSWKLEATPNAFQSFSLPVAFEKYKLYNARLRVNSRNTWSKWSTTFYMEQPWTTDLWAQNRIDKTSSKPLMASAVYATTLSDRDITGKMEIATDPEFKNIAYTGTITTNKLNQWHSNKVLFEPTLSENTSYYMRSMAQRSPKSYSGWSMGQFTTGYLDARFEYLGVVSQNLQLVQYANSNFVRNKFYNIGSELFVYDIFSGYYLSSDLKTWAPHISSTTNGKSPNYLNFFGVSKKGDVYMIDQVNKLVRKSGNSYESFTPPEAFFMDEYSAIVPTENNGIFFKTSNKGVGHFQNGLWTFFDERTFQSNKSVSIAMDQDEEVWTVMEGGGVWSNQNGVWKNQPFLANWRGLIGLAFDNDKTCYAYGEWGVVKLNRDLQGWEIMDAFASHPIRKLIFGKKNEMYLASYTIYDQDIQHHALLTYIDQKLNVYDDGLNFFKEPFDLTIFNDKLLILTSGGELHSFEENKIQRFEPKTDYCAGNIADVTITSNSTFAQDNETKFALKNTENGAIMVVPALSRNGNVFQVQLPESILKGNYTLQTQTSNPAITSNVSTAFTIHGATTAEISMVPMDKFKVLLNTSVGPGLVYQWQRDGMDIANATTSSIIADQSGDYTVRITNQGGCQTKSSAAAVSLNSPTEITLLQNTPNPIAATGEIAFYLPQAEETVLNLYNVQGQKIAELKKGYLPEGWHFAKIDGNQLAAGIYIYELKAGNTVKSLKMAR